MVSIKMPLWLRVVSLVGVVIVVTAAGLFAYRWYSHPVTLTLAVGSVDGEAAKAMSAIASQLTSDSASVRFQDRRHRHRSGSGKGVRGRKC